ncbi:ATP-binding protein [Kitasatospora purpeofusca]|uniref:ATP-binding protein n=1 Tax=Kitasatospora purpeofusca TaxID=67352 RepID=UPI00225173CD|nr:ATP-binding protein [Kitasatospora purpeofusca]MCX4753932.1 ATP-binding protein [Kitasatospora purpeofusca]WSR33396.1 ATP-binding protein [Kitasatospora purpeofusca]WSR41478.1 ATP-binding protein [Kitasatospora purpeofusca]
MCETSFNLSAVPESVGVARHRLRDVLRIAGVGLPEDRADSAELLVSELVTNALRHAAGEIGVEVAIGVAVLRVSVRDGSDRPPQLRVAGDLDTGGRGLALVEALASRHGWEPAEGGGKVVWFELPLAGPATTGPTGATVAVAGAALWMAALGAHALLWAADRRPQLRDPVVAA